MAGYKGLRWNLGGPFQVGERRNATARVEVSSQAGCLIGESDQLIVVMKQGNACGAKGLTKFEPCYRYTRYTQW